jgi:hypothetical protein
MKRAMVLAAAALVLTAFVPEKADAQYRRFGPWAGVGRGPVVVGRRFYGPRGYYGYRYPRPYYRPGLGVGAAVGLGILGGAALGAAAAAPYYDPCLRQREVIDAWCYARLAYVRVC